MANSDERKNIRVGILTGGGDAPGLNAAIEGVVTMCLTLGWEVYGFLDGWAGVLQKRYIHLDWQTVFGIKEVGGTILFSSRTPIYPKKSFQADQSGLVIANLTELGVDILFVLGGEDTNGENWRLYIEHGIQVIGLPKTIDRDIRGTDWTIGHSTAVSIIADSVRRLHTTAQSHHRVLVVEAMGRHAGWMAMEGGLAGNAHGIWLPEMNGHIDVMELFYNIIWKRYTSANPADHYAILVVAEGSADQVMIDELTRIYDDARNKLTDAGMAQGDINVIVPKGLFDDFGHVNLGKLGVAKQVATQIQAKMGRDLSHALQVPFECRAVELGHLQRAGAPSAFDTNLGYRLGVHAVELARDQKFGVMTAIKGDTMAETTLEEAVGQLNTVPENRWRNIVHYMEAQC